MQDRSTLTTESPSEIRVLFLCTGNSCRSIIAEAILNHRGKGRFKAYSAGSQPTGEIHPGSLAVLEKNGVPTDSLYSKSVDIFSEQDFDTVITVCDHAHDTICPTWKNHTILYHWPAKDPASVTGDKEEIEQCFEETYDYFNKRIQGFVEDYPLKS